MLKTLISSIVCLLFAVVLHAHAQTQTKIIGLPVPKVDTSKVTYDRFEDKTTVEVEIKPAKVALPDGSSELFRLPISARFECSGQDSHCNPTSVFLSHVGGSGLAYCNETPVVFVADSERVRAGDCGLLGGVIVLFKMTPYAFLAIAKASRVEVKIGSYVWTFDGASLDAIRSLAHHIESKPSSAAKSEAH